jgi:single-stranded-DNA-specific exonuclease
VRCVLEDSSRNKLKAISFRSATQPLGEALLTKDRMVHVALRLKRNAYGGQERVEAEIVDAAAA